MALFGYRRHILVYTVADGNGVINEIQIRQQVRGTRSVDGKERYYYAVILRATGTRRALSGDSPLGIG